MKVKVKGNGITRKIDECGRFVIPKNYRKRLGLNELDIVEIYLLENGVFVKKVE